MEKKKVLIINEAFKFGGTNLVAIRLQQALDPKKYDFTYLVRHNHESDIMDEYIEELCIKVIYHPEDKFSYIDSYKFYKDLFSKEHFDIIHSHYPFYSAIPMLAGYKAGIKKRVTHSHFSYEVYNDFSKIKHMLVYLYRIIMRKMLCKYCTDLLACSQPAGEYLFGKNGFKKNGVILNNAIEIDKYKFDPQMRKKKRLELGVDGKTVLCHIGAMYYIKNQTFLLDVFKAYHKSHPNSVLVLIGDGVDRKMLEEKCEMLEISNSVVFTGWRNDVNELLCAVDCIVFPSLHEAFPLTLVEGQVSKLACVVSDTVIPTIKYNENVEFVSLKSPTDKWCKAIDKTIKIDRANIDNSCIEKEFDIKKIAYELEKIYNN